MCRYKQSKYTISQRIGNGVILCSNFRSGKHIFLSEQIFELFNDIPNKLEELIHSNPEGFNRLKEGLFLVDSNEDELSAILNNMINDLKDKTLYHVIINPTLDCNLSCWYCYENKIPHSMMSKNVENSICKHLTEYYKFSPFRFLKLSFFGGEPFLNPNTILNIISFAKEFCLKNSVELILDFTTNGTLLSNSLLNSIKDYPCFFQITLDGNKTKHNKIKYSKDISDAFSTTISNIYLIQKIIPKSIVSVRINFDSLTLLHFDEILSELDNLDRLRSKIILKKVWQVNSDSISKEKLLGIIYKVLEKDFFLDYYSQGGICFADRNNQITFNYDGGIYKCTTITHFNKDNSLGEIDQYTGLVSWKNEKIMSHSDFKIPDGCKLCKLFPFCGGPCRRKTLYWKPEDCFLGDLGLSMEEYALIQLKIELTKRKIYSKYENK